MTSRFLKIACGPLIAVVIYILLDTTQTSETVSRMGGIAAWIAAWWILDAVPLALTALLPVFLFPLSGIMSTNEVAPVYMNDVLFLFIGGFLLAFAMERWNLHKRISLRIITAIGADTSRILLGLMLSTYAFSMWMSNTATTMMMIAPTLAVISRLDILYPNESRPVAVAMLLGVAYAASIGGMATLVGTPPNMIFLSHYEATFPDQPTVSFLQWFLVGFPLSFAFLIISYFIIKARYIRKHNINVASISVFEDEYKSLGKMSFEEKSVMMLFGLLALLWFTRADLEIGSFRLPGWSGLFSMPKFFQDGTVAVLIASLLFVIPSRQRKGEMLLEASSFKRIPFEIILLFGGGFALAAGFTKSGLSEWFASQLGFIGNLNPYVMVFVIALFISLLSEVTSNMAATQLVLPILASIAIGTGIHPLLLMLPATFAASCGFMLPVATAPNTIVFSSERLKVTDMVRTGFWLDIVGVVVISVGMMTVGKLVFGW